MGKKRGSAAVLSKESYKHKFAKAILMDWLKDKFKVVPELELGKDKWKFIPDITTLTDGHIQSFYEITHLHPVDSKKLAKMQYYCYVNKVDLLLHEVDAEWIMDQTEKPEYIENFTFDLSPKIETL